MVVVVVALSASRFSMTIAPFILTVPLGVGTRTNCLPFFGTGGRL